MKSSMKHRLAAAVLATVGLSLAGVATLTPTIAQPEAFGDGPPEMTISVIQLKHMGVREFDAAGGQIALDPYSTMTYDQRSNSILLNATAEATQRVNDLVDILDVQLDDDSGDEQTHVYPLVHAAANGSLISSLFEVMHDPRRGSSNMRLSMDQSTNQLIARGTASDLSQLEALLKELDKPMDVPAVASDINIRLLWLTTEATDKVPGDAKDVTDALADMGITGLGLAAQTVVRATNQGEFISEFITGVSEPWHVDFRGTAQTTDANNWKMVILINARQVSTDGKHLPGLIDFTTNLTTQAGHFVVLGVSPIGDTDSVFVLQVVNAD